MGTQPGQNFTRLIKELEKNAPRYNVFQAIFIAEQITRTLIPSREEEKFDQKGLNFRPHEMYVYPPTDIRHFSFIEDEAFFVLNFMGLYGINAPLPRCYHEQVAIQQSIHGPGFVPLQNFLDIFNNRFYWLYYQSWKKYRVFLDIDENFQSRYAQRIFSFAGVGAHLAESKIDIPPFKLLQLSGLLSQRVRNRSGLQILLKEFIPGCEVSIREFVPNRVKLSELPVLGKGKMVLGQNSIIGKTVLDYLSKICIRIGPIPFEDYLNYLPGGDKIPLLRKLIDLYLNDNLEYDIEFIVSTDEMKVIPWNDRRLKLGQSIWLGKPKQKSVHVYYDYNKLSKVA